MGISSSVGSIARIGLEGVKRGQSSAAEHAAEIVSSYTTENESIDFVDAAVHLNLDTFQVKASAQLIKLSQELDDEVGRLVNTTA